MRKQRNAILTILLLAALVALLGGCAGAEPPPPTRTPTPRPTATGTPVPVASPSPTLEPTSTLRPTSTPTPTPLPPTPTPSVEDLAAQYPELAAILNNPEVSALYKDFLVAYEQGGEQAALGLAQQRGLLTPEGEIRAALVLDTEERAGTIAQLEGMGIRVLSAAGNRIEIAVPPALLIASANQPGALLNQLSGLEHVVGVQPPG